EQAYFITTNLYGKSCLLQEHMIQVTMTPYYFFFFSKKKVQYNIRLIRVGLKIFKKTGPWCLKIPFIQKN
ncbi:hypothetical protein, partial [Brucella sp. CMUL 018]|uniref:hypothetical protein n=1 Tax=Brucella sp. CMUL 018 TaxID=1906857 RepID=UPI001AECA18D